jgi:RNA polymerase sigma factor (sigma-70 family)
LTQFKKGNRKAQVETQLNEEAYEVKSDGSDALEKENQLNYFYKAVQELNKVEKALIFLYLEGLPHREIAANLGISEGNARVKLNRTISKLQKIVIQKGYE